MSYIPTVWKQDKFVEPQPPEILRAWFNKTEGTTCYRKKMKAYIPVKKNVDNDKKRPCMEGVNQFIKDVNKIFGGSTVYNAWGSWYDAGYCDKPDLYNRKDCQEKGGTWTVVDKVDSEDIKVVEIGYGEKGKTCLEREQKLDYLKALTRYGKTCNQRALGVTDDGEFFMGPTGQLEEQAIQEYAIQKRRIRKR